MSLPTQRNAAFTSNAPLYMLRGGSLPHSDGCSDVRNNSPEGQGQHALVNAASGLSLNSDVLNACCALPQPEFGIDWAKVFVGNDESSHQSAAQVVPPKFNGHGRKPSIECVADLLQQSATAPQPNPVPQPITVTQNNPSLDIIIDWIKTDNIEMLSMLAEQQPNWQALVSVEGETVDYQLRDVCALFGKH